MVAFTLADVPSEAQPGPSKPEKPGERLLTAMLGVASTISTYPCPVCRKAHPLDLDRLQVSPLAKTSDLVLHARLCPAEKAKAPLLEESIFICIATICRSLTGWEST